MIKIPYYESSYFLFSNFSPHIIEYKGISYPTLEHAFQAQKFLDEGIREKIRSALSPLEAFNLGQQKDGRREDWAEARLNVMYELMKAKVMQHKEVKERLILTGDEEIVEESPTDYFWGSGKDGSGENNTGKILMRVRKELI